MNQYEYQTSFFPVTYYGEEEDHGYNSNWIPTSPNPESIYDNNEYQKHMAEMGTKGWELISVQPLLRGAYGSDYTGTYGYGYSLTAGYYLFWKRILPS
ncbi:MAG: hypothetical protein DRR19_30285 [Candidatus Parabeggiatoa sp. nov. 1]|nr:MAG: hypothetical protein DRR19_30285 [Gammaproteobacteria bacterium]